MRPPRFTIRSLLLVIAFVDVAVAALRASTDAWDGCLLGLTALGLLTAVLLAIHRNDRERAFWLGLTLFGGTYFIASLIPPIGSRLPTTRGLAYLDSKIPGRERDRVAEVMAYTVVAGTNPVQGYVATLPQGIALASSPQGDAWLWDPTTGQRLPGANGSTGNFIRIGHSLLALLLAFAGGHLSRHRYDQGRGED